MLLDAVVCELEDVVDAKVVDVVVLEVELGMMVGVELVVVLEDVGGTVEEEEEIAELRVGTGVTVVDV